MTGWRANKLDIRHSYARYPRRSHRTARRDARHILPCHVCSARTYTRACYAIITPWISAYLNEDSVNILSCLRAPGAPRYAARHPPRTMAPTRTAAPRAAQHAVPWAVEQALQAVYRGRCLRAAALHDGHCPPLRIGDVRYRRSLTSPYRGDMGDGAYRPTWAACCFGSHLASLLPPFVAATCTASKPPIVGVAITRMPNYSEHSPRLTSFS